MDFLGTEKYGLTFGERNHKCYVLSGYALACGGKVDMYSKMIHGSIHQVGGERIGHAWLILGDGRIWEPISADIMAGGVFVDEFRPETHRAYSQYDVVEHVREFGHWGPWIDGSQRPEYAELWDDEDMFI